MKETPETKQTVPPGGNERKLQVLLSKDAYHRIHAEAGRRIVPAGKVVNDLAIEHLPPVYVPPPDAAA